MCMNSKPDCDFTVTNPDKITSSNHHRVINILPWAGFFSGIVMWLIDAAVDVFFIHTDEGFWQSVFSSDLSEMWMRTLVVIVMTSASVVVQFFMRRQDVYAKALLNYQDHLEELVNERTQRLQYLADFDELTGIYNRRKFTEYLNKEMDRARRYHQDLSLVMCDIDFFKNVNDSCGHDKGDEVLKSFSDIFRQNLRKTDTYARWGGEEFIILMSQTDIAMATKVADKLRQIIGNTNFGGNIEQLTASFGISQLHNTEQASSLIKRADKALYDAKHSGRNCVSIKD